MLRIYSGYSPDRVVADPELNEQFVSECQRLGLVGNARFWNTLLFRDTKGRETPRVSNDQADLIFLGGL